MDSSKVSPSRLNSYVSCGVAFEMHYVQGIPEQVSGSAALFGNVIHKALEGWALNREQDLLSLMRSAWLTVTEGTSVKDFIAAYQPICVRVLQAEQAARDSYNARPANVKAGKTCQAPRMTKDFKDSAAAKEEAALIGKWYKRLEKDSPWRFTDRDPIGKLYGESLVLAKRYERRYRAHPRALYTELAFECQWRTFGLNGYIDAIEPWLVDGVILGFDVVDYKTYAKESAEAKDWRQGVFYDVALRDQVRRGVLALPGVTPEQADDLKIRVVFDYPRLETRRVFEFGSADYDQLERELLMYRAGVDAGVFMPAEKGRNPDFCSYPENCCLRNRGGCAVPADLVIEPVAA